MPNRTKCSRVVTDRVMEIAASAGPTSNKIEIKGK
jgi:hypothetical protein